MTGSNHTDTKTVKMRIKLDKELLITQLKKTPIVQLACEKTGIGRATYYRWRKDDKRFTKASDMAIRDGSALINDMAESQLLSAIRDKNMTAIIFWLKHHHPSYETRIELKHAMAGSEEKLTPKQEEIIRQAIEYRQIRPLEAPKEEKKKKKTTE